MNTPAHLRVATDGQAARAKGKRPGSPKSALGRSKQLARKIMGVSRASLYPFIESREAL